MSRQLYAYSLIRSLYDRGDDYIDSFWPLMIKVLPKDGTPIHMQDVQSGIESDFRLRIPQHSLGIISTRAARRGYINRVSKKYALTEKGKKYLSELETERDAERRINELIEHAKNYVNSKLGLTYSLEKVRESIETFVRENLESLEQFLSPDVSEPEAKKALSTEFDMALLEYFTYVERNRPVEFKTLQDILCGSIISTIVHIGTFEESAKRFDRTQVFLDSNYLFSLLGLNYEEGNKPAQELFELMKAEGSFEFRAFDFTVDEMTSVLSNYDKEQHHYSPHIKVRSLFGSLKAQGWTSADVREFTVGIESRLWKKEIALESTDINLKKFETEDPERRTALRRYKPDQVRGSKEQNHDLAAIDLIKKLRKKRATRIEKCQALFLTSDLKLAQFNYIEDGHKELSTINEVIPDRLLTNLLWLKRPASNGNVSLSSIVAIHSRQLFIDQAVWKRFYETVTTLRKDGSLDDKDLSILLFDGHIQEVLREIDLEDLEQLKPELIIEKVEDAKKRLDESKEDSTAKLEVEPIINEQEKEQILNQLLTSEQKLAELDRRISEVQQESSERVAEVQRESNERVFRTLTNWKKRKESESERQAVWLLRGTSALSVLLLIWISTLVFGPLLEKWQTIEPIAWEIALIVPLILSLLGIKLDPLRLRSWLKQKIFNRIYKRKLKVLDEIETNFVVDIQDDGLAL